MIIVVLSFIFLFVGFLGNIAVIIYNIFLNHDKTPSSWLVTHLALADLLVCLILYPTKLVQLLHEDVRDKKLEFCKMKRATFYVSLFLSIMILLRGAHSKHFWGGGVPNFLGPTFMAQYPNNNHNKIFIY